MKWFRDEAPEMNDKFTRPVDKYKINLLKGEVSTATELILP